MQLDVVVVRDQEATQLGKILTTDTFFRFFMDVFMETMVELPLIDVNVGLICLERGSDQTC